MNKFTTFKFVTFFAFFLSTLFSNAQQQEGLTLYSNSNGTTAILMDTAGVTVHTWTLSGPTRYSLYMMGGGTIVRTAGTGFLITPTHGGMYTNLQKIDYNNNIVWNWSLNTAQYCLHHDIAILPNGNILAMVAEKKTPAEFALAGGTNTTITGFLTEKVIEIQPVGSNSANIVWEWKAWDHLIQNVNPAGANYYSSIVDHPELININFNVQADLWHMNGMDYNPVLDQIALSSRWKDELYIIDHSTTTSEAASHTGGNSGKGGDLLYRWGNPPAYMAAGPKILDAPHDSHWIPEGCPDAGMLVGLNISGVTVPSNKTAVDKVLTPRTGYTYSITPGAAFTPTTVTGRYLSPVLIGGYSNSEQFKNGNQMMCFTTGNIWEINPAGTTIWTKYVGPGFSPQAHRYPACYVNNPAAAQPSITVNGGIISTTNAVNYQWYFNGDAIPGATSQTYQPTQDGIYLVRITDLNSCVYLYSNGVFFAVPPPPPPPPPPPTPTSLKELTEAMNSIQIYPNPNNGIVNISLNGIEKHELSVYSASGQLVLTEKNVKEIDMSSFKDGLYFFTISTEAGSITKKITLMK